MRFNEPFNAKFFLNYMKNKSHEEYRQCLINDGDRVAKEKQPHGTVIGIALSPQFFAFQTATGVDLIEHDGSETHASSYTDEVWYQEHEIIESRQELYHSAYKHICPVMYNAPNHPIWLNKQVWFNQQDDMICQ